MTPAAPTRFQHVANGTSTTATIRNAGIPGAASIWADVLHEGPVPGGLSDDQLLEVRARHLASGFSGSSDEVVAELRGWRGAIDNAESYDELVLWYEHDLFDQLNLIQVLSRIGPTLSATKPVSLICIGSFPGRPLFKGLGELTPDELASLFETRQPVSDAQYALAGRAWDAFRAPDPRALEELLRGDTSALPFLAAALRRHLEEFPSAIDGLSRTEQRLMTLASAESIEIWTAFPRMHDLETAFYIADGSFWQVVQGLASSSPPLVSVDLAAGRGQATMPAQLPSGTFSLTDTGRAVLSGDTDRIGRCGLDRWLGGVHLVGSGPMWRWDPAQGRMIRS